MDNRILNFGEERVLFIIDTPFQALCTLSAIQNLQLSSYSVLVILPENQDVRNQQLLNILDSYHVSYKKEYLSKQKKIYLRLTTFFCYQGNFKTVFVGYYNDLYLKLYAFRSLKNGGSIYYLDDGIATISLFQNKLKTHGFLLSLYLKSMGFIRNINHSSLFYSIYSGIANRKYHIFENKLSCLTRDFSKQVKAGVYFIGTNTLLYCERQKIPLKKMESFLALFFEEIKKQYPGESVVYLPHGRDKAPFLYDLCQKHHVSFVKPDTCSEIYLLNVVNPPVMVCGFTSTVLFNVKQLFPETKVINLLMNSQKQDTDYGRLSEVSNYYSEHGVELDERKI